MTDKTAALKALDRISRSAANYADNMEVVDRVYADLETIRAALLHTGWRGIESCPIDTHGKKLIFTDGKRRWFDTVPSTFDKKMRQWIGDDIFDLPTHWTDTAPLPLPPSDSMKEALDESK